MINKVLRFLFIVFIIAIVSAGVVLIIGLVSKWSTNVQFSNGYFFGGIVLILVGFINAMGARTDDRMPGLSDGRISTQERQSTYKLLSEDIAKGNNRMAYLGVSGLLLWAIAGLIPLIWS